MEKLFPPSSNNVKKMKIFISTILPVACLIVLFVFTLCLADGKAKKHILIYTKNGEGYVHDNIPASVECLKKICKENNWTCEVTDEPSIFTPEKINSFDVLVFSNSNNQAFETEVQRDAFQNYIRQGGAFVGIHSACASERDWPWFWANLGGKFVRHPPYQKFDIKVIDRKHPSTNFLDPVWKWEDECYYLNNLNPDIHILLAADLTTIEDKQKDQYPGQIFGSYFPLAWCHEFEGGRQWYTALGHSIKHYEDENFIKHLTEGIRWAMQKKNRENK